MIAIYCLCPVCETYFEVKKRRIYCSDRCRNKQYYDKKSELVS